MRPAKFLKIENRKPEITMSMKPDVQGIPGLDSVFVAGKWKLATSNRRMSVINPANEEVVTEVALPSVADAAGTTEYCMDVAQEGVFGPVTVRHIPCKYILCFTEPDRLCAPYRGGATGRQVKT